MNKLMFPQPPYSPALQAIQDAMAPYIKQREMMEAYIQVQSVALEPLREMVRQQELAIQDVKDHFAQTQGLVQSVVSEFAQYSSAMEAVRQDVLNSIKQLNPLRLIELGNTISSSVPPSSKEVLDPLDEALSQIDDHHKESKCRSLKKYCLKERKFTYRFSKNHVQNHLSRAKPILKRFAILFLINRIGYALTNLVPENERHTAFLLTLLMAAIALWQELTQDQSK